MDKSWVPNVQTYQFHSFFSTQGSETFADHATPLAHLHPRCRPLHLQCFETPRGRKARQPRKTRLDLKALEKTTRAPTTEKQQQQQQQQQQQVVLFVLLLLLLLLLQTVLLLLLELQEGKDHAIAVFDIMDTI